MLNESKFQELYKRQQESGLTVRGFCLNEGIATSTFYYWLKKLHKVRGKKEFIPLVVKSPQALSTHQYTKNRPSDRDPGEEDDGFLLELVYPNGTRLRIKKDLELTHLRALICLYE